METGIVYTGFLAFVTEMFAPLLLCSSIPLGSPPVQDPNLGKIAPKQCVFYVGWAGMGAPDAKSAKIAPNDSWPIPKSATCEPRPPAASAC